jgi:alpha-tubulin suppressor-like RCC1 family protein
MSKKVLLFLAIYVVAVHKSLAQGTSYAHTQPATLITSNSATLNGTAVPNASPAVAWFEWGPRGNYDQITTPTLLDAGTGMVRVGAPLSGLTTRSQYQYRLVVSNAVSVVRGASQLFQTGGRLVAWGRNWFGETNVPTNLGDVVGVDAGGGHCVAVKPDGTVVAWGWFEQGQTNVPPGLSNVVAVSAGGAFTLALKADGTVVAWGDNLYGQTNVPSNLSNVVAVAAGNHHSLALKADGTVVAWGFNDNGQASVPAGVSNAVAIAAGVFHSLALRDNGTVVAWGTNTPGANVPAGLTNVVAINAKGEHSLALKTDGKVSGWGTYWYDSVNHPMYVPGSLSGVVSFSTSDPQSLALKSDGTVVAWGGSYYGEANVPANLSNVVFVATGDQFNITLGRNTRPEAQAGEIFGPANGNVVIHLGASDLNGDPMGLRIATLPGAGDLYQCAGEGRGVRITASDTPVIDPQGRVVFSPPGNAFGRPYSTFTFVANDGTVDSVPATINVNIGQPKAFTQRAIQIGPTNATLTGMVVPNGLPATAWFFWGSGGGVTNPTSPVDVGDGQSVVRVTAPIAGLTNGGRYQCKLMVSNAAGVAYGASQQFSTSTRIVAWGDGSHDQKKVTADLTNAVALASGGYHGLAIKSDGGFAIWGDNRFTQTNAPPGLTNLIAIDAGFVHSLALKADGTVVAWGFNDFGQTNVPGDLSNVISVAAGWYHNLALKADGTVAAWGDNLGGKTNVPPGLSNVVAVTAGAGQSLALQADGTLVSWGYSNYSQIYVPTGLSNAMDLAAGSESLALMSNGTLFAWDGSGPRPVPGDLADIIAIGRGTYHFFAIRGNGTLVSWENGLNAIYGETNVSAGVTAVMAAAGGMDHSYALGTRAPLVSSLNVTNFVDRDVLIYLQASDPDGDPIVVKIGTLPGAGTLFQYAGGSRGPAFTTPDTLVTDALRRVIFAPATGGVGRPYATFSYRAEDGIATSAGAIVTVNIVLPSPPAFSVSKCKWRAGGVLELNFTGQTNGTYRVWASTNLMQWEALGTVTATNSGSFNFLDGDAANWPRRFYRAGAP